MATRQHEHRCAVQARGGCRFEWDHGAEKHGAGQDLGSQKEQGGRDVGAIGIADSDDFTEASASRLVFDKIGEFVCATNEVGLVENSRSQTAEKAGLAVFEDLPAGAQQGRAGPEDSSERNQVIFVPAGAVEE